MKLFVITKLSDLLIDQIVTSPDCLVVCTPAIEPQITPLGARTIIIRQRGQTPSQRDRRFNSVAMPGVLDGVMFPDSDLPLWKTLSIDRLRFWFDSNYDDKEVLAQVTEFSELIVSFDMGSYIPWVFVNEARKRGVHVIGVKVVSLFDVNTFDYLRNKPVDALVVSTDEEARAVRSHGIGAISYGIEREAKEERELEEAIGIYFENRYDWKFLALMSSFDSGGLPVYICMPNNTEWSNFLTTFPDIARHSNVQLRDEVSILDYETVLLPKFYEHIVRDLAPNADVAYYDVAQTEKALFFDAIYRGE